MYSPPMFDWCDHILNTRRAASAVSQSRDLSSRMFNSSKVQSVKRANFIVIESCGAETNDKKPAQIGESRLRLPVGFRCLDILA
jgi:hypothetical protein